MIFTKHGTSFAFKLLLATLLPVIDTHKHPDKLHYFDNWRFMLYLESLGYFLTLEETTIFLDDFIKIGFLIKKQLNYYQIAPLANTSL